MKKALVLGAGGFIGNHLVTYLRKRGYWVKGIDLKEPDFFPTHANEFIIADLREQQVYRDHFHDHFDEVYQLAADMGGAGYIFTGESDFDIVHNSAMINLNVLKACIEHRVDKVFFSSSACVYPSHNQNSTTDPDCSENSVYPANPDSEYGWEKLFSERLYQSAERNYNLNIRIARFHNIYGPGNVYDNGKEKAPAALCRKIALAENGGEVEIWGDGKQTRSFLYIDDCLDAINLLMNSDHTEPINIGSEELIAINDLAAMIAEISNKKVLLKHVEGPQGVRGRVSNNEAIQSILGWQPKISLYHGFENTYNWISKKMNVEPVVNSVST